ncbi:type VI secretion system Vgr family protein [Nannocystis pusilla]|uniref:type VI secretion system Vgr family protein n=1 Tax=Nannocystis pusilla TaxID=889268 RepID=UPI003BF0E6B9
MGEHDGKSVDGRAGGHGLLTPVLYSLTWHDAPAVDWRVRRIELLESISDLYTLRLHLLTEDLDADVDALLGASCTLTLARAVPERAVHGIVRSVDLRGVADERLRVELTVVPALALFAQRRDTRFWQDKTALDIVQEVLKAPLRELGRGLAVTADAQAYPRREYCVQYRETDLEFVRRLLAEEGIAFYFRHDLDDTAEVLTLLGLTQHAPELAHPDLSELPVRAPGGGAASTESIAAFDWRSDLAGTSTVQRDWDWQQAADAPYQHERRGRDSKNRVRESYDHDDRRLHADDGKQRARRRLEAMTATKDSGAGRSDVAALAPGHRIKLALHPRHELDGEYLLARVEHRGEAPEAEAFGDDERGGSRYDNSFECVRADVPLRPPLAPARPRVHGPHTAIVVGPAGEEIHTDEHGRIKVRFHWDRLSPADDTASCWIRVAQTWAGAGWGATFLPRIGMEVLVEFIDGDPDRPLVTGCVYNSTHGTPYPLPASKTRSAIKTESTPGGGGFNEISFEDAKGAEELFIHAQRDLKLVVLRDGGSNVGRDDAGSVGRDQNASVGNNRVASVGANETASVGANQTVSVGANQSISVGANQSISVGASQSTSIGADQSVTVQGSRTTTVTGSDTVSVTGERSLSVDGGLNETITSGASLTVTGTRSVVVSAAATETVGASRTVMVGAAQTHTVAAAASLTAASIAQTAAGVYTVQAGGAMTLSAGPSADLGALAVTIAGAASILLTCGGSAIQLDPGGVTINAGTIKIAGGSVDITGGIVKIN